MKIIISLLLAGGAVALTSGDIDTILANAESANSSYNTAQDTVFEVANSLLGN